MSGQVAGLNVSRETLERLEAHVTLLRKWTAKINLVSPGSLDDAWERHIVDSAQLFPLFPESASSVADLGSGGGFPGVVLAILAAELRPDMHVTLVESDTRKAAFLRTILVETGVEAQLEVKRVMDIDALESDVITARALAPLERLLALAERHLSPDGTAIFPKGRGAEQELETALARWAFDCERYPSQTDDDAVILKIRDIHRA